MGLKKTKAQIREWVREHFPPDMTLAEAERKLDELLRADDSETFTPLGLQRILQYDKKGFTRATAREFEAFAQLVEANPGRQAFHTTEFVDHRSDHSFALLRWNCWTEFGGLIAEASRPADAPNHLKGSHGMTGWWRMAEAGLLVWEYPQEALIALNIRRHYLADDYEACEGRRISLEDALTKTRTKVNHDNIVTDGTVALTG